MDRRRTPLSPFPPSQHPTRYSPHRFLVPRAHSRTALEHARGAQGVGRAIQRERGLLARAHQSEEERRLEIGQWQALDGARSARRDKRTER